MAREHDLSYEECLMILEHIQGLVVYRQKREGKIPVPGYEGEN